MHDSFVLLLYFKQNESETSEESYEEPDDEHDIDYVQDTDSENDVPISSLAVPQILAAEELPSDTVPSTSVGRGVPRSAPTQNYCFVCQKPQFKIARHFTTHIKEDADIAKALSFPAGSRSRKELLEKLRNRGNFMHNNEVLKKGCGSLKVKRKANGENKTYEYCIHCRGMFLRSELWRHMRRCSSNPEGQDEHNGQKRVLGLTASVMSYSGTMDDGVLKMLSHGHNDEIASVVQNDFCLLRFAQSLYTKDGHDRSAHSLIRQQVRELGRFLLTLRKVSNVQTLEDAVKPANFMDVIKAVKITAGYEQSRNWWKTPSLAIKIGQSLVKVSEIIHCHALMTEDKDLAKSTRAFHKLHQAKWSEYISHSALATLSEEKYNKAAKQWMI